MGYFGDYFGGGGGGSPDDDSVESISPDTTVGRLTPIITNLSMPSALDLFVIYKSGGIRFEIYNAIDGFIGNFNDQSTVVVDGTDVTVTLLPNGGWWTGDFSLDFISGRRLEL